MESGEPLDFTTGTRIQPFTKYGVATVSQFKTAEREIKRTELLKDIGLVDEEIKLFEDVQAGILSKHSKIENSILEKQLQSILRKIHNMRMTEKESVELLKEIGHDEYKVLTYDKQPDNFDVAKILEITFKRKLNDILEKKLNDVEIADLSIDNTQASTSNNIETQNNNGNKSHLNFYPDGHPMNSIKELEKDLFNQTDNNDMMPLNKRRKIMKRLERKEEEISSRANELIKCEPKHDQVKPGSKWDVKEAPEPSCSTHVQNNKPTVPIGPKNQTMYTVQDRQIIRLEPMADSDTGEQNLSANVMETGDDEANSDLWEGTKMCIDDIRKMKRFRDYEPGVPSLVLHLQNLSPKLTQEQLTILFNQFVSDNGGPITVRLMGGNLKGQAFVAFQEEHVAIEALEEIVGTVLLGRPIVAQFSDIEIHNHR